MTLSRRKAMQSVAALAAGRLAAEDYELDELEPPEQMDHASYQMDSFTPSRMWLLGDGALGSWELRDGMADSRNLEISYNDCSRVTVALEARSGRLSSDAWVDLEPEQAKEVAAAIFQAAVELEARMEGTDGDD